MYCKWYEPVCSVHEWCVCMCVCMCVCVTNMVYRLLTNNQVCTFMHMYVLCENSDSVRNNNTNSLQVTHIYSV